MKSILYIAATLMICAGIYGFVDYKKTNRNKEFIKMYDSKEVIESVITPDQTNSASTRRTENAVVNKETAVEEKIATVKDQTVKQEKTLQKKKTGGSKNEKTEL